MICLALPDLFSKKYDNWPLVLVQSNRSRWEDMVAASNGDPDRAAKSRPTIVKFEPVRTAWEEESESSVAYNNMVLNNNDDDPGVFKVPEVPARFKNKRNNNSKNNIGTGPKLSRTLANASVNLCKFPYPDHATGNSTIGELASWLYADLEYTLTLVATSYGVCSWKFYFPPPECVVVAAMSRGIPAAWLTIHDSGYTDVRKYPTIGIFSISFQNPPTRTHTQDALEDVLNQTLKRLIVEGLRITRSTLRVGSKNLAVPCWDVSWKHTADKKRAEAGVLDAERKALEAVSKDFLETRPPPSRYSQPNEPEPLDGLPPVPNYSALFESTKKMKRE